MLLGFDIGGTKCGVCTGKYSQGSISIKNKTVLKTRTDISPYEMIDEMCRYAEKMTNEIDAIGISCGGPLDSKKGVILSPPNLKGWDNIKITNYLKKRFSCGVYLQNDANACAVAEWKFGAGKGAKNMIFLTFGTGMGAGLILNGRLYEGTNGLAGEAGHIRLCETGPVGFGKAGSFEGFCSGGGLAQLGKIHALEAFQCGKTVSYCNNANDIDGITAKTIAECAKRGEPDALKIFDICAGKLGMALAFLTDILNPEKIVIGSIYQRCEELLSDKVLKVMKNECIEKSFESVQVVPAALGENIGDYAAIAAACWGIENEGGKIQ